MSIEGPALQWVATHIKHHALSDRESDPHSPVEGFFHAHIGWMFGDDEGDPNVYCCHLVQDRMVVFVSRTFLLWSILALVIPFAIGGWTGLLWGGLVAYLPDSPCHLERQFCLSYLWQTCLRNPRSQPQRMGGRLVRLW